MNDLGGSLMWERQRYYFGCMEGTDQDERRLHDGVRLEGDNASQSDATKCNQMHGRAGGRAGIGIHFGKDQILLSV